MSEEILLKKTEVHHPNFANEIGVWREPVTQQEKEKMWRKWTEEMQKRGVDMNGRTSNYYGE